MLIQFEKEKEYQIKEDKMKIFSSDLKYDLIKNSFYTSQCFSEKSMQYFYSFYLGLSNGYIARIKIPKGGFLYSKFEHIEMLSFGNVENKHSGSITCILSKIISDEELVFSSSTDGKIKIWRMDVDIIKYNYYYKTLPDDISHLGGVLDMVYAKSENFLITCGNDKSVRIFKVNTYYDNIKKEFNCTLMSIIKDFPKGINIKTSAKMNRVESANKISDVQRPVSIRKDKLTQKQMKNQFVITKLSIRDEECVHLYAGDSTGTVHVFEYRTYTNKSEVFSNVLEIKSTKAFLDSSKAKSINNSSFYNTTKLISQKQKKSGFNTNSPLKKKVGSIASNLNINYDYIDNNDAEHRQALQSTKTKKYFKQKKSKKSLII